MALYTCCCPVADCNCEISGEGAIDALNLLAAHEQDRHGIPMQRPREVRAVECLCCNWEAWETDIAAHREATGHEYFGALA